MSKRDDPQLRVRIPTELKETLELKAKANRRTLTAEIVDRLEATVVQDFVNSNYYKNGNKKDNAYSNMAVDFEALTDELEELRALNKQLTDLEWLTENEEELYEVVNKLHQLLTQRK